MPACQAKAQGQVLTFSTVLGRVIMALKNNKKNNIFIFGHARAICSNIHAFMGPYGQEIYFDGKPILH